MRGTTAELRRVLPELKVQLNSRGHARVFYPLRCSSGPSLLDQQAQAAEARGGDDDDCHATACVGMDTASAHSLQRQNETHGIKLL